MSGNKIKTLSIFFAGFFMMWAVLPAPLWSQLNLNPQTPKEKRRLKNRVLTHTDHGYVGLESGFTFNVGPCFVKEGSTRFIVPDNKPFGQSSSQDFTFGGYERIFGGYAYKKHQFEMVIGFLRDRVRFGIEDSLFRPIYSYAAATRYNSIGFRYFYDMTPFKTNLIKMTLGIEAGYCFRSFLNPLTDGFGPNRSNYTVDDYTDSISGTQVVVRSKNTHVDQFYIGFHARMDIKLFKNVTLVLNSSFLSIIQSGELYDVFVNFPGGTQHKTVMSTSALNIQLNAGLAIDFFSPKKKRQTYDRLNIEDPYRDK